MGSQRRAGGSDTIPCGEVLGVGCDVQRPDHLVSGSQHAEYGTRLCIVREDIKRAVAARRARAVPALGAGDEYEHELTCVGRKSIGGRPAVPIALSVAPHFSVSTSPR